MAEDNTAFNKLQQKLKVRVYKNKENPDDRLSLCGEKAKEDKDGRTYFDVPGHLRGDLMAKLPSYEFSKVFNVDDLPEDFALEKPAKPRPGQRRGNTQID